MYSRDVTAVLEPGVEPGVMRAHQAVAAAEEATIRVGAPVAVHEPGASGRLSYSPSNSGSRLS